MQNASFDAWQVARWAVPQAAPLHGGLQGEKGTCRAIMYLHPVISLTSSDPCIVRKWGE